jgi:UDP-N-acetylglucosamine 2-epimerase (non-hydrolysing)/GDP/UDP-N,N'-diacetylbacillosamine 2-epimerase (hydrolysing)
MKWLMKEIDASKCFHLQLAVTGAHLLAEQGHTIDLIREDGFSVDEVVDAQLDTTSPESIAASMGRIAEAFSHALARLSPDYVVVLGDRYELLPIVNSAFVMRIPVIHLSGGDITEGAIDDGIRNSVTMLAEYHFPGTEESAGNIIRMRGSNRHVWAVGEPGLDCFFREPLMSREALANELGLENGSKWVLFTFHAETKETLEYNMEMVKNSISVLLETDGIQIVATYSNADYGGNSINTYLDAKAGTVPHKLKVIPSLGSRRYLSYMQQACFVIGNSSSGIIEAPVLGVPVVNIGNRQKGRHQCKNILQSNGSLSGIRSSIICAMADEEHQVDYYWGDGHTAERIVRILERELGA